MVSDSVHDDTFGDMIDELHKTTIRSTKFHIVLYDPSSSKILREDKSKFHRVLKELTDSGLLELGTIISLSGVMNALLNGCLPKMMVKLRRDHHRTKWDTIIKCDLKMLCKLECVSIPPICFCTCPP